ncbi:hypothetical protein SMGD1_1209 [Sulfurimonas gotlandica GD1]|jgi:uncharacterized protein (DUF302 family)|uniref:DUF302 domain-containing protein n=1 Tax=Sulfurimonas gotlandica (strain DSM 19862 / JCM 16533 / GD1) TaxID=929558 RepID=H1FZB9_SULGG|nr:hypothetical protein [Sulfurimonas gotlandica]EHP29733.1 hypothetical protein SMGD1_1209 [Sulfurimonas gotlandica GD1]
MIKKLLKTALVLSTIATIAFGAEATRFNVVDGNAEAQYNSMINKKIGSVGFVLSDPHERINDAYKKKYGSKTLDDGKPNDAYDSAWEETLDNLGFFSIANDVKLRELLITNPELGGFSPFNLHVYKKKNENKTYVGHLAPTVMLDIVGVKDAAVRTKFAAMFPALDELVQKEIGGKVETTEYTTLPATPMMNFEITFDRPADLTEYIDEFQGNFEAAFEEKKYIIAGYKNFKESYNDLELDFGKYDAYFVYSLCHFTYSYNIFNKGRPDAGAFAPCSMYMYIEKDSNKLIIGMPKLANWTAVLNMKDEVMNKSVEDLDKEIIEIMIGLGAKEI